MMTVMWHSLRQQFQEVSALKAGPGDKSRPSFLACHPPRNGKSFDIIILSRSGLPVSVTDRFANHTGIRSPLGRAHPSAAVTKSAARSLIMMLGAYVLPETRSEEHMSERQSLMRISYAVTCFTKKKYEIFLSF